MESVASSADGNDLIAVQMNGNILISNNSGETWTDQAIPGDWQSVASSTDGSKLVAVQYPGDIWTLGSASGNVPATTTTIQNGGGGAFTGGLPGTTSSVASTSTATTIQTTIAVTSTILPLFSSFYNVSANTPIVVNISNAGTTVTLASSNSKSTSVKLVIINVTKSTTPPQSNTSIIVLNVSTLPPTNITITLSVKYPCSLPSNKVTPYKLTSTGWREITNFSINAISCTVTFTIPPDPVVGLFFKHQPATSTVLSTIAPAISSIPTTIPQGHSYYSNTTFQLMVLVVVAIVVVIAAIAVLILRPKRKK